MANYGRNKNIQSQKTEILVLILSLKQSVNLDNLLPLSEVKGKEGKGRKKKLRLERTPWQSYVPLLLNPQSWKRDPPVSRELQQISVDSRPGLGTSMPDLYTQASNTLEN